MRPRDPVEHRGELRAAYEEHGLALLQHDDGPTSSGSDRTRSRRAGRGLAAAAAVAAALALPAAAGSGTTATRTISFSGYTWQVKSSNGKVGPGPNSFSSSPQNVWVDTQGRLHLAITRSRNRWYCAEIVNTQSLGYGTYTFTLDSRVDALDPNVTLGLFTWSDAPAYAHRELDVEFARWGNASDPTNGQYVVQPWDATDHLRRITQPAVASSSVGFTWAAGAVSFTSSSATPASWQYSGSDVPLPGDERARMNLWLYRGAAPTDGKPAEVIVRSFTFTPG
jgi:hypothetical protein